MESKIRMGSASDVMTREVVTGHVDEPLGSILGRMDREDISEIPIVDDRGHLRGIIDYRVLVRHRRTQATMKARHLMFIPPEATPSTPLVEIAEHMISHHLRAIPITDGEVLVGIVSRTDIVRFIRDIPEVRSVRVEEVMAPEPRTIRPDDQIRIALAILREIDERNIPVLDDGRVVGVIGVKDITPALLKPVERSPLLTRGKDRRLSPEVKGLMNEPIVVRSPAALGIVLDTMIEHDISMVPILEGEHLVGIVTHFDLMEFVARYRDRKEVLVQFSGLEAEPEVFDAMYDIVGRLLGRISSFVRPETLTAHITEHGNHGAEAHGFYEVRTRMSTRGALYTATRTGWDLLATLDETCEAIERQVRRDHDREERRR